VWPWSWRASWRWDWARPKGWHGHSLVCLASLSADLSEEVLRRVGPALRLGYPVFLSSPADQSAYANLRSRDDPQDPGLRCGIGLHGCLLVSDLDGFVDHYDPVRGGLAHDQQVLSGAANGVTAELFDLGWVGRVDGPHQHDGGCCRRCVSRRAETHSLVAFLNSNALKEHWYITISFCPLSMPVSWQK